MVAHNFPASRAPDNRRSYSTAAGLSYSLVLAVMWTTFTLPSSALNLFVNYTLPGGSFWGKFHPASYLSLVLLALMLASGQIRRRQVFSLAIMAAIGIYLMASGRGALGAVVVDTQLTVYVIVVALERFSDRRLRGVESGFVAVALLNAGIVAVEYLLQSTWLPVPQEQDFFRPAALLGGPISAACFFNCAILICMVRTELRFRQALILLFSAAVVMCGVRGPLAVTIVLLLAFLSLRGSKVGASAVRALSAVVFITAIASGIYVAAVSGALDRAVERGLWDESAQSRFLIFGIFDVLSKSEFWWGMHGSDDWELVTKQLVGGTYIENAFITFTVQAGVIVAAVLAAQITAINWKFLRASWLLVFVYVVLWMTTLTFGVKNPVPLAFGVAGYMWMLKRKSK